MQAIIGEAGKADLHMLIAGIDATNVASIALHSSLGFRCCGTVREAGFVYDEGLRTVNAPARLEGYFQSERYFEDAAEAIRAGFTPPAEESGWLDALAARLLPPGPKLSLHIRRGDYTNPATMAFHGLMGPDY